MSVGSNLPVAMPTGVNLTAANTRLIESFGRPEDIENESNPVAAAKRYGQLFSTMSVLEERVGLTKTYAGAYAVRLMDKADKSVDEIREVLGGVSASRVSQLRLSARLIFEYDFVPGLEDTALLTSRGQNDATVKAAINAADKEKVGTEKGHAAIAKALETYKNDAARKAADKAAGKTRPTPNAVTGGEKVTPPTGNAARLTTIHEALSAMTSLSSDDMVSLLGIRDEISRLMGAAPEPLRVKAAADYAKRTKNGAKSPATA